MDIKQIESIAKTLGPYISSITNKPFDTSGLKMSLDDENVLNDEDIKKALALSKRDMAKYDWKDYIVEYNPVKLVKWGLAMGSLRIMGKFAYMKYNNGDKIAVNPSVLKKTTKGVSWLLAHELTHVQDDQLYGDQRFPILERTACLEERLIDEKHKAGILKGYIKPDEGIKSIKQEIKACKDQVLSYMTVLESHAEYVKDQFTKMAALKPTDYLSMRDFGMALLSLPLLLAPGQKKKMEQYSEGKKLIEMAYQRKVDMSTIYGNLPTAEEFKQPEKYFDRLSQIKN